MLKEDQKFEELTAYERFQELYEKNESEIQKEFYKLTDKSGKIPKKFIPQQLIEEFLNKLSVIVRFNCLAVESKFKDTEEYHKFPTNIFLS